jgi:hypothetical protein
MRCASGRRALVDIFVDSRPGVQSGTCGVRMHSLNLTDGVIFTACGGLGSDKLCSYRTPLGEIPFVVPRLGVRRDGRHSADSDAH